MSLIDAVAELEKCQREIADLHSQLSASADRLVACSSLHTNLKLPDVLDTLIQLTSHVVDNLISIQVFIHEQDTLHLERAYWVDAQHHRGGRSRPNELAFRATQTGKIIVKQGKKSPASALADSIAVPMNIPGRTVGVMIIHRAGHPELSAATLDEIQWVANQAAQAVENALLFRNVSQQAFTDALTGVPNRRAFDLRLEEETRRSSRYQHKFTLAMLDVNNFKEINDTHGHPAGDLVLQHVIGCLRSNLRETDFFARFGGDEFAIILPETDYSLAQSLAQRLLTVVKDCPVILPGGVRQMISISIGLASYPEHAITAPALLGIADQALYRMKNGTLNSGGMRDDEEDGLLWLD